MARRPTTPAIFRILLPARDLARSRRFYERLLATPGRVVAPGRVYFDAGPVLLGILDFSRVPRRRHPRPTESVYFSTPQLDRVHARAGRLGCLAEGVLHGDAHSPLGRPVVRPWGERSFYVEDPSGNSLCFVEAGTEFTGSRAQVAALRRSSQA
jgi:catechol 2,3-dioxygenase-like lactoylglutathione lyase family enzyme